MLRQEFYIEDYDWNVYVYYDTTYDDADEIMDCLYNIGCGGDVAKRAFQNLSQGKKNTGLTFSKNGNSCIVLSRATDEANFCHTVMHEIYHLTNHIAKEYRLDVNNEPCAYLAGDIAAIMLPYSSKFIRNCCKTKKYRSYEKR